MAAMNPVTSPSSCSESPAVATILSNSGESTHSSPYTMVSPQR